MGLGESPLASLAEPDHLALLSSPLNKLPWIKSGATTRKLIHPGMSLEDAVRATKRALNIHHLPAAYCRQRHTSHVRIVGSRDFSHQESVVIGDCDGLIATDAGVALAVFTADCVPILLVEEERRIIGAVHAGWRGTLGEIAVEAISGIRSCGGAPENVRVWIGPAIGCCCYEVSEELALTFAQKFRGLCNRDGHFLRGRYLDLAELNRQQLIAAGVPEDQISVAGVCTKHAMHRYYSYRGEGAKTGRIVSLIAVVAQ
ncbi:MAG: peptidoglycan editing factor PgeF [Candidatus Sumerlaeaceae bacterium]|nr:peptidoglycan editing factor PgeF [Candidatus Sumerlaeaceae bacterium]